MLLWIKPFLQPSFASKLSFFTFEIVFLAISNLSTLRIEIASLETCAQFMTSFSITKIFSEGEKSEPKQIAGARQFSNLHLYILMFLQI